MAISELSEQQRDVVECCAESMVLVEAKAGENSIQRSGILWAQTQSSWYVFTAGHCLQTGSGSTIVSVTLRGEGCAIRARVLGTNPGLDSAVLRIDPFEGKFKAVGRAVRASEMEVYRLKPLIVVGFPGDLGSGDPLHCSQSQSGIECKICSLPKEPVLLRSGVKVNDAILIHGGITPGYSGGVFDLAGGLVGTICGVLDVGYAVVMRQRAVADWVDQIIQQDSNNQLPC